MNSARLLGPLVLLLLLSSMAACDGRDVTVQERPANQAAADAPSNAESAGNAATTIAGIAFEPPSGWTSLGASGMRKAQFQLASAEPDLAPAEVNVFYFGPQSGGGVEPNLQRWIGQMTADQGAAPARSTFTADGMNGHVVSLDGAYNAGGGRPMGGGGEPLPGYRLVGVVLEGPQGSVFFKLTGPVEVAGAMEDGLMAMVAGARRSG